MADEQKAEYSKPTSQVDLERRLADDSTPVFREFSAPEAVTEDGFVGTDVIYQNAANKTDEPIAAKSGVEKKAEQLFADAYGDGEEPAKQVKDNYQSVTTGAQSTGASSSDSNK
jgi:hypothetical protein